MKLPRVFESPQKGRSTSSNGVDVETVRGDEPEVLLVDTDNANNGALLVAEEAGVIGTAQTSTAACSLRGLAVDDKKRFPSVGGGVDTVVAPFFLFFFPACLLCSPRIITLA